MCFYQHSSCTPRLLAHQSARPATAARLLIASPPILRVRAVSSIRPERSRCRPSAQDICCAEQHRLAAGGTFRIAAGARAPPKSAPPRSGPPSRTPSRSGLPGRRHRMLAAASSPGRQAATGSASHAACSDECRQASRALAAARPPHSVSCRQGAALRTTLNPATSSAAARWRLPAAIRAGGPPGTRRAAASSTATTSSKGTSSGRGGPINMPQTVAT